MNPILPELIASLGQDHSHENLARWCDHLIQTQTPIRDLLPVLEAESKVPMYFTWLLGATVEKAPEMLVPVLPDLFSRRNSLVIKGFRRSLSKWMYYAGLPQGMEGEALDALFLWARDPSAQISTRRFALLGLCKIANDYPDLVPEIRLILEEQQELHTPTFRKQVARMLELPGIRKD